MNSPYIPPTTSEKLKNPAPLGARHRQMLEIACSLSAQGINSAAIFQQLRPNYGMDVPDPEISNIITWAEKRFAGKNNSFAPFSDGKFSARQNYSRIKEAIGPAKSTLEQIQSFLTGFSCSEADLFEASPIKLPGNYREDSALVFDALYFPEEKLNIVTEFRTITGSNRKEKANPIGNGITKSRNDWLEYFRNNSVPESEAGGWLRLNPTTGAGISDDNIADFRFALLESDIISLEIQYSLLAKLPLPISAILTSGGKSLHAWVRIAESSAPAYRDKVAKLFSLLSKFGFDSSNRNPSRLSRLPGVQRKIGAQNGGIQKLIYLNPFPAQCRSIL